MSRIKRSGGGVTRQRVVLLAGATLNGVFASLAMWLAGRSLGLEPFEALAQLWTLWGLTATGLAFAFQQWEVARSRDLPVGHRRPVPVAVGVGLVASAVVMSIVTIPIRGVVFGTDSLVWPLAAATLPIGTALTGMAYATLARRRTLYGLALVMASENAVRLLITGVLASVGATAPWYASAIPAGFLVVLLPLLHAVVVEGRGVEASGLSVTSGQLPGLAMVGFSKTFLVFGGPLLLGVAGGEAAVVSTLFLILIVPRVPFLLVNALVPSVTVQANEAVAGGRSSAVRRGVMLVGLLGAVLAGVAAVMGFLVGDPLARLFFDAGGQLDPLSYGILGGAVGFALAATLTNPLLIALGGTRQVTLSWAAVVLTGALLTLVGAIGDPRILVTWMLVCALGVVLAHVGIALTLERSRPTR